MRSFFFSDFFVELIDNDRNKQVHHKEGSYEYKYYEKYSYIRSIILPWTLIDICAINSSKQNIWPVLKRSYFEKSNHRMENIIKISEGDNPFSISGISSIVSEGSITLLLIVNG